MASSSLVIAEERELHETHRRTVPHGGWDEAREHGHVVKARQMERVRGDCPRGDGDDNREAQARPRGHRRERADRHGGPALVQRRVHHRRDARRVLRRRGDERDEGHRDDPPQRKGGLRLGRLAILAVPPAPGINRGDRPVGRDAAAVALGPHDIAHLHGLGAALGRRRRGLLRPLRRIRLHFLLQSRLAHHLVVHGLLGLLPGSLHVARLEGSRVSGVLWCVLERR
mmetsp:Transcript_727/g.2786  ORF Transcript_727/g.2786 Transcript_727/m.2786 type:complete len:227 (+) Transcript_727:2366-3046(+)